MHLNAKKIAFLGLLLAFTVILVVLSGVLEMNTLFLLAAASFGIGIAIRECGLRLGTGFFIAGILLSFILAPNKLYCITFGAMGLYLVLIEFIWTKLGTVSMESRRKKRLFWVLKFGVFNLLYIPILNLFPKIVNLRFVSFSFEGISPGLLAVLLAGQIFLFLYDMAYEYFQKYVWGKARGKFLQ